MLRNGGCAYPIGLACAGFLFFQSISNAQQTFDGYLAAQKARHSNSDAAAIAKGCGVAIAGQSPHYAARMDDHWASRRNLLQVEEDAQTDLYDTAEIWHAPSGGTVAVFWFVAADVREESELIVCVNSAGHVLSLLNQTAYLPVDGGKGWTYRERATFGPDGRLSQRTAGFVDERGNSCPAPGLDPETRTNLMKPANATQALAVLNAVNKDLGVIR